MSPRLITNAAAMSLSSALAVGAARAHIVGNPEPLDLVGSVAPFGDDGTVAYAQFGASEDLAVLGTDSAGAAIISLHTFAHLGTYTHPDSPGFGDVAVTRDGTHAVLASNDGDGLHVVDITNPAMPVNVATIGGPSGGGGAHASPTNILLLADMLYVVNTDSPVINVFDLSDPGAPVFVRDIVTPETLGIHDVSIDNGTLYAAGRGGPAAGDGLGAVYLFDVENVSTSAPALIATIDTPEQTASACTTFDKHRLLVTTRTLGGALKLYDIQDPQVPVLLSTTTAADYAINAYSPIGATVLKRVAFVAWSQAGVEVLDLDQLTAPDNLLQPLAFYDTSDDSPLNGFTGATATNPYISTELILVADSRRGLFAVDAASVFPPQLCVADTDEDLDTDVFDFAAFLTSFGRTDVTHFTRGDVDGDADVDVFDFAILAADFGCPD